MPRALHPLRGPLRKVPYEWLYIGGPLRKGSPIYVHGSKARLNAREIYKSQLHIASYWLIECNVGLREFDHVHAKYPTTNKETRY